MPDIPRWLDDQSLQEWLKTLPHLLDLPMFAGRFDDGEISVEEVNDPFCRLFGIAPVNFPVVLEELFEGKEHPVDMDPLRKALVVAGDWERDAWESIPGETFVSCLCRRDKTGHFLAVMEDRTEQVMNRRLLKIRDSVLQMMELYEARDLIRQILKEAVEQMEVDWIGVFLWDEAQQRWMLSVDEANQRSGPSPLRFLLTFAQDITQTPDGQVPYAFGELEIKDGCCWTIPWKENAGRWTTRMEESGAGSLSARVLLTGCTPAVLLSLSRRSGGFARINREVLTTFWPILVSLFERNRAVEGITSLYRKDPVTGLYASTMLKSIVSTETKRAERYGYPLAFMHLKIANLDQLAEKGGSGITDETLRIVARQVLGSIRNVDIAGRLDDSVLLLMPHTPMEGAKVVAGRLAERLKTLSPVPNLPLEVEPELAVFDHGSFGPPDFPSRMGL
jgi:diguanylate cyclase (GGDEF)-like protein